jgi:hypothetical protein
MPARRYYDPVPRGLELQIRERLAKNAEKTRHRGTGHRKTGNDSSEAADDE